MLLMYKKMNIKVYVVVTEECYGGGSLVQVFLRDHTTILSITD